MRDLFRKFSVAMADAIGAPWMFIANVLLIIIWAGSRALSLIIQIRGNW